MVISHVHTHEHPLVVVAKRRRVGHDVCSPRLRRWREWRFSRVSERRWKLKIASCLARSRHTRGTLGGETDATGNKKKKRSHPFLWNYLRFPCAWGQSQWAQVPRLLRRNPWAILISNSTEDSNSQIQSIWKDIRTKLLHSLHFSKYSRSVAPMIQRLIWMKNISDIYWRYGSPIPSCLARGMYLHGFERY